MSTSMYIHVLKMKRHVYLFLLIFDTVGNTRYRLPVPGNSRCIAIHVIAQADFYLHFGGGFLYFVLFVCWDVFFSSVCVCV